MKLTYQQKQQLISDGYVQIPGVVPKAMVDEAVKAINHSMGEGSTQTDWGAVYAKELWDSEVIADLFNKTPAKDLAESVLGEDSFYPIGGAQIALRFPQYQDKIDETKGAHLDGMLSLSKGKIDNFTALVGVLLSDLPNENAGNFTVWPGTHKQYEDYFKEHGPEALLEEETVKTLHRSEHVPLPKAKQITGKAGDIVICHYQLIHTNAANISPHIRYATFFRLTHKDLKNDWRAPLVDMWRHWPGIQEVLSK